MNPVHVGSLNLVPVQGWIRGVGFCIVVRTCSFRGFFLVLFLVFRIMLLMLFIVCQYMDALSRMRWIYLKPKSEKCIFVSYPSASIHLHKFLVSHSVMFDETKLWYDLKSPTLTKSEDDANADIRRRQTSLDHSKD